MPGQKRLSIYILDRKSNRTIIFDADTVQATVQNHFAEVFDKDTGGPVERPSGDQTFTVTAFATNVSSNASMYKCMAGNCVPKECKGS